MQLIPFTSDPAQSFSVLLGESKFSIEARWNETAAFWTFDLTTLPAGVRLVSGAPILIGQDMLSPYALGIGGLVATDINGIGVDAGPEDLGDRVTVTWFSEEELTAIRSAGVPI